MSEDKVEDALTEFGTIRVGTALHAAHLDDLPWVADRVPYIQDARSVTLRVKRGEDEHILVEVVGMGCRRRHKR